MRECGGEIITERLAIYLARRLKLKTPVLCWFFLCVLKTITSLRADEIKLWLTPDQSAKQRRNPCSGLPAVYPDLSTRHDWPVKKSFVLFVVIANQVKGEFETHFR